MVARFFFLLCFVYLFWKSAVFPSLSSKNHTTVPFRIELRTVKTGSKMDRKKQHLNGKRDNGTKGLVRNKTKNLGLEYRWKIQTPHLLLPNRGIVIDVMTIVDYPQYAILF